MRDIGSFPIQKGAKEKTMNIGKTELKHGLMVAPMAGIGDRSFRRLCMAMGAEYSVSEMVSAKALCYEQHYNKTNEELYKTAALSAVYAEDMPMAIQLFGCEPEFIAGAVGLLVDRSYKCCKSTTLPAAIDINMGCPVHKIVGNGEGSALMKDPELAGRVAEAAVSAAKGLPVTVKIRAGWDFNSINAPEVAKILESAGVSVICVHGRTRSQLYSGHSSNEVIARVKDAVKIPVVGNGDIVDGESAIRMIKETNCDGIMIGRAAIGNPFIFSEVLAALRGEEYQKPSFDVIASVALGQVKSMIEEKGERVGISEARKHLCRYLRGVSGASEARGKVNSAESYDEIKEILFSLI
jgi:nifR3 family TIM-barrel protein